MIKPLFCNYVRNHILPLISHFRNNETVNIENKHAINKTPFNTTAVVNK